MQSNIYETRSKKTRMLISQRNIRFAGYWDSKVNVKKSERARYDEGRLRPLSAQAVVKRNLNSCIGNLQRVPWSCCYVPVRSLIVAASLHNLVTSVSHVFLLSDLSRALNSMLLLHGSHSVSPDAETEHVYRRKDREACEGMDESEKKHRR